MLCGCVIVKSLVSLIWDDHETVNKAENRLFNTPGGVLNAQDAHVVHDLAIQECFSIYVIVMLLLVILNIRLIIVLGLQPPLKLVHKGVKCIKSAVLLYVYSLCVFILECCNLSQMSIVSAIMAFSNTSFGFSACTIVNLHIVFFPINIVQKNSKLRN